MLNHAVVLEIASQIGRTPAQVVLRWAVQSQLGVIPKSKREERMLENRDLFSFTLSKEQMDKLDAISPAIPATSKTSLIVVNHLSLPVHWYWIREGQGVGVEEVFLEVIDPGTTSYQQTWQGHTFLAKINRENVAEEVTIKIFTMKERIEYVKLKNEDLVISPNGIY